MIVKNDDFTITIYENRLDGNNFKMSATVLQSGSKEAKAIKVLADKVTSLEFENAATKARAEKAEAMVERLTEAGEPFITYSKLQGDYDKVLLRHHLERWNAIIAEWEHRNDKQEE